MKIALRYTVQHALPAHISALADVERAAAQIFPNDLLPEEGRDAVLSEGALRPAQAERRLWVAISPTDQPVGFAVAEQTGRNGHLAEMSVHPDHQRNGIGQALLEAVVGWARSQRLESLTLTTFAHLPWNAPFYRRAGFRSVAEAHLDENLAQRLREERHRGMRDRVAMRLELRPSAPFG